MRGSVQWLPNKLKQLKQLRSKEMKFISGKSKAMWWLFPALIAAGLTAFSIVANTAGEKSGQPFVIEEARKSVGAENNSVPVIVELFTSEGCSSCPPADDALARFEKTQPVPGAEIIALEQHVDYWNRLGWTDPYSAAGFSRRQGDYASAFGKDGVYTPQMIVDGQTEFPGGNKNRAREVIAKAAQIPKATIEVSLGTENAGEKNSNAIPFSIRITNLPGVKGGDTAEVMFAITESNLFSDVARGENAGRRLNHAPIVRLLSFLGSANSQSNEAFTARPTITIARGWKRKNLRAVVFVQERASRRVLGATMIGLTAE